MEYRGYNIEVLYDSILKGGKPYAGKVSKEGFKTITIADRRFKGEKEVIEVSKEFIDNHIEAEKPEFAVVKFKESDGNTYISVSSNPEFVKEEDIYERGFDTFKDAESRMSYWMKSYDMKVSPLGQFRDKFKSEEKPEVITLKDIQRKLPRVHGKNFIEKFVWPRLLDKEVMIGFILNGTISKKNIRSAKIEDVKYNPRKMNENDLRFYGDEKDIRLTDDELSKLIHKGSIKTKDYYIHLLNGVTLVP